MEISMTSAATDYQLRHRLQATWGYSMERKLVRPAPLAVLILAAEGRRDMAEMLGAVRGHFALVCDGTDVDMNAVRDFQPDVVVIDLALADPVGVRAALASEFGGNGLVFVGVSGDTAREDVLSCFDHQLEAPVLGCELEQLLWQISSQRTLGKLVPDSDLPAFQPPRRDLGLN